MGNSPQKPDPAGEPANEIGSNTRVTIGFIIVAVNLATTLLANLYVIPQLGALGTNFSVLSTKMDAVQHELTAVREKIGGDLESRIRVLEQEVARLKTFHK